MNDSFKVYEVSQTPAGDSRWATNVLEMKLSSIAIKPTRDPFLSISGKQYFAATSNPSLAYGVAVISADLKFEHMLEVQLMDKNPQYTLKYIVDPYELLRHQLRADSSQKVIFLFQHFIAAPEVVLKHTLLEATTKAEFSVIFKGSYATIKNEQESFGRRFVFRRYKNPDLVTQLVEGNTRMFVEDNSTDPPSTGNDLDPGLLVVKNGDKKYKLSNDYIYHLRNENVWFKVSDKEDKQSFDFSEPIKVNVTPILVPMRNSSSGSPSR